MSTIHNYFSDNKSLPFLRIISILFICAGIVVMLFGYGFGAVGIPLAVIGTVVFFICQSRSVSDKDYDTYMASLIPALSKDDFSSLREWNFSAYGAGKHKKRGRDGILRTDCYVSTCIQLAKSSVKVYRCTGYLTGETCSDTVELPLPLTAKMISRQDISYFVFSENGKPFEFPVPPNNYDVEELLCALKAR